MNTYKIGGQWLKDLNSDLKGSDRSCAVLAGAILDERLKLLLQTYLLPVKNGDDDKLLGRSRPIDSFSARIELSQRLYLISNDTRRSLDWIRDIRNEAAHDTDFDFNKSSVKDKIANIIRVLALKEKSPTLLTASYDSHKGNFVAAIIMLTACLDIEIGETHRTTHTPTDAFKNATLP